MISLISWAPATEAAEPEEDLVLRSTWDEVRAGAISPADREEIDAIFARHCA